MTSSALRTGIVAAAILTCGIAVAAAKDSTESVRQGSDQCFIQLLGQGQGMPAGYQATQTTYWLHLPDDYDPKRAYPMILAVSPGPEGAGMYPSWVQAAKKHPLIFACPNQAGNETDLDQRGQMVVDTLFDVRAKYHVDPGQIYITGFSGGGRMSTGMVLAFPGLFAGHIPIGGIFIGNDRNEIAKLQTRLGDYVFSGETCFNRPESEAAAAIFKKAGMPHELMIGAGLGHTIPDAEMGLKIYEWFLARQAAVSAPALLAKYAAAEKLDQAEDYGPALAAYEAVAAAGVESEWVVRAVERAKAIRELGARRLAEAKTLPGPDALELLDQLAARFAGSETAAEARALRKEIADSPGTARLLAERRQQTRDREAREALAQAAALEKEEKLSQAQEAFAAVADKYADTAVAAEAGAAAARLSADPRTAAQRREAEARKLMQRAENLLKNKMTAKARELLDEIAKKYPDCETGRKARKMAAEIK